MKSNALACLPTSCACFRAHVDFYLDMIIKFRIKGFLGLSLGVLPFSFFISCSNSSYRQNASFEEPSTVTSPAMVEKLWLARHHYDQDRRLIIPKVGGARWGAVQEYTADGNLVYRDWWVRNLKIEDLEANPPLEVEVLRDDDSNLRPPVLGISGIETEDSNPDPGALPSAIPGTEPVAPAFPEANPDPFAPIPSNGESGEGGPMEGDPFSPILPGTEPSAEPDNAFPPLPTPF